MPTEIFMTEINTLLPLLLQCLDLNNADVKAATINNLIVISQENPQAVESHISSLASRLLKSAVNEKINAAVRKFPFPSQNLRLSAKAFNANVRLNVESPHQRPSLSTRLPRTDQG